MRTPILAALLGTIIVCAAAARAQADTTFSYQGQLNEAGAPADGTYAMEFSLFNALNGGSQIGSTVTIPAQAVSNGIFSSQLDFGPQDFSGTQYWLEIVVDGNMLSPRQPMTASPFSIQTRGLFVDENNDVGIGTSNPRYPLHVLSNSSFAIYAENTAGIIGHGIIGASNGAVSAGVVGQATATSSTTYGGWFYSNSSSGRGVQGEARASTGITYGGRFESDSAVGRGVYGEATAAIGTTYGGLFVSQSTSGRGVYGVANATSGTTYGGWFENGSTGGRGVFGYATATTGNTDGVLGQSDSTTGRGVFGFATATSGVNFGVVGHSNSSSGFDFWASGAGSNYGSPSSRRFKSNIVPIDNPLNKLAKLQGVYFDWDEEHGSAHDVGMIAEEVGAVIPEIVQYEENGIDAIGMDYSKMTPLLVEAVNALRAEKDSQIQQLQAENNELKARLDRIEMMLRLPASN